MYLDHLFQESDDIAVGLLSLIELPLLNDSSRIKISDVACSLSLEHWHSVRSLLNAGLLSSALVVHRAQFESIVRSIWLTYAASDGSIEKLTVDLNLESEQAAKNMPQIKDMLNEISKKGPPQAHQALERFKDNSWNALNSYAHAGIHPLRRHQEGYPIALLHSVLCNANGLAVLSCMQAVVLSGEQSLQKEVLDLATRHPACMPPPL
jgi:hypothetical protein